MPNNERHDDRSGISHDPRRTSFEQIARCFAWVTIGGTGACAGRSTVSSASSRYPTTGSEPGYSESR